MISALDALRRVYGLDGVYVHLQPIFRSLQKEGGFQNEAKLASVESLDWLIRELFRENAVLKARLIAIEGMFTNDDDPVEPAYPGQDAQRERLGTGAD
jgi:hypothetical protein